MGCDYHNPTDNWEVHHSQRSVERFTTKTDNRLDRAVSEVRGELQIAMMQFGSFNSAHEGFAVLKEEVDELWEEVKKKGAVRDMRALRNEATKVAAMALRFIVDLT